MSEKHIIPGFDMTLGCQPKDLLQKKTERFFGGFQTLGVSQAVMKGITFKGYRKPTPIQRKTIPLIIENRDVVAMAKTGSGKTACFLIPMLEKLKQHSGKGIRALILSPTRELAIQTFKFTRELGKFHDLKITTIIGGDSLDSQFSSVHNSPDVIIATPGRLLHLCVEMELTLSSIEYVVFDEADRLFEMGFGEQLQEILKRLPSSKQTVMFSATMPKVLADFAEAGMRYPTLIRLDTESKLPEGLSLKFLHCRQIEKYSALLVLLKYIIPKDSQILVFVATQFHIQLISLLLNASDITNTFVYSSMDPSARKINTAKFINSKASVLIVTDVAARGLDIPSLDYVINFHFPGKPKLFIHRVGRCARAGKIGTAYTLFSTEDQAHFLDLHNFLDKSIDLDDSSYIGTVPNEILEEEHGTFLESLKDDQFRQSYDTSEGAYKKFISTRPAASTKSNKTAKDINFATMKPLEELSLLPAKLHSGESITEKLNEEETFRHNLLLKMKNYKPNETIFEVNPPKKSASFNVMMEKRAKHKELIKKNQFEQEKINAQGRTFIDSKDRSRQSLDGYIPHQSIDKHTEDGLVVNCFTQQARNAEFSITDKVNSMNYFPGMKKWDRIKKKMVTVQNPRAGKIRTESGLWIASSYKTGRYQEWKEKNRVQDQSSYQDNQCDLPLPGKKQQFQNKFKDKPSSLSSRASNDFKTTDQIVKKRIRTDIAKRREHSNKLRKQERTNKRKR